jgi:hypothetical protein
MKQFITGMQGGAMFICVVAACVSLGTASAQQKDNEEQGRMSSAGGTLRDVSDSDLLAVYRYLKYIGPLGESAPAYVPPDQEPKGPFVQFPAPPK